MAYVPRGVLDPLLENYAIKNPDSIKAVLNAKQFIPDYKFSEEIEQSIPIK